MSSSRTSSVCFSPTSPIDTFCVRAVVKVKGERGGRRRGGRGEGGRERGRKGVGMKGEGIEVERGEGKRCRSEWRG